MITSKELPILTFESAQELRTWLIENHAQNDGIWIRIYKKDIDVKSVISEEVLDEGLCFGWSESIRRKDDDKSYLQKFTPRRKKGTTSKRYTEHIQQLIKEKKMTPAGLKVLEL